MGWKKAIFLILVLSLLGIFWHYQGKEEKKSAEISLRQNSTSFLGRIVSYNKSRDRSYGIIKFEIVKSSKAIVNLSDPKLHYPYRIENGYGEFYGYVPLEIRVGQLIELNAGEKSVNLYDDKEIVAQTSVFLTTERKFIEYINDHTSFVR